MVDFSYIGFNEQGEAVAVCIDDPRFKKDTAKTIAEWIREGRTISRLPHQEACAKLKSDWEARIAKRAQGE